MKCHRYLFFFFLRPHDLWISYAPTGNVTAEVVYVNYASKEDFELIKAEGIDTQGKIAIARYGNIFRGTKAMIAQEYGIAGMLIYSDPADDGYAKGPVYPEVCTLLSLFLLRPWLILW